MGGPLADSCPEVERADHDSRGDQREDDGQAGRRDLGAEPEPEGLAGWEPDLTEDCDDHRLLRACFEEAGQADGDPLCGADQDHAHEGGGAESERDEQQVERRERRGA